MVNQSNGLSPAFSNGKTVRLLGKIRREGPSMGTGSSGRRVLKKGDDEAKQAEVLKMRRAVKKKPHDYLKSSGRAALIGWSIKST